MALVVIPEEAELLIPLLRTAEIPLVHLLVYAAPVTRKMQHFNRLDFYSIPTLPEDWEPPSWLAFELGILGGRLYFEFLEYHHIKESLCFEVQNNGAFSEEDDSDYEDDPQATTKNTLAFLGEWLSLRRQGQDITHTPMGYVCQGWQLRSGHPFFTQRLVDIDFSTDGYTYHPSSQSEIEIDEDVDSEDEDEGEGDGEGDDGDENENEDYVDEDKNDDEGTG